MTTQQAIRTNTANVALMTDSYKLTHYNQYVPGTERVYSYFEAREGAEYPYTVFFGLQYLLKEYLAGQAVTDRDLEEAHKFAIAHLGPKAFNYEGWSHVVFDHNGCLPVRIKAVPEGTPVDNSNVLMTIENTCPKCWWLTNALETMLVRTWYPSTVATLSRHTFESLAKHLKDTGCDGAGLPFMFHDFGARGASSHETAGLGGMAHIILSQGTDTMEGMQFALKYYEAVLDTLAFSVAATEHSVMTSLGPDGEYKMVGRLIDEHPTGVLSVVADSYNIYKFVIEIGTTFRDRILAREDGPFVVRPDSTTKEHPTPAKLMVDLTQSLWHYFGGTTNEAGYKVLDPHVRLLWGDGINPKDMNEILTACARAGFAAENYVFGMGGGLLQKVNRDTQRFAFKCSAQQRNGAWFNVQKSPLDQSKASKAGKFSLIQNKDGTFNTIPELSNDDQDLLEVVFENGKIVKEYTFDEIRQRAAIL